MKLGKNFLLGIIDDSNTFKPLAFAQSCSYDISNTLVKVSSPNTGGYDHYRKKTTGWTMQHEGLVGNVSARYTFNGQQYDFISLIGRVVKTGEPLTCRWSENDEIKQGQAIIKSFKEVASENALAKVSLSLQGTGELKDFDVNNLEGDFVWIQHDIVDGSTTRHALTLVAQSFPVAGFDVIAETDYHQGTEFNIGHWDNQNGRTQTFTRGSLGNTVQSVRAVRTIGEQAIDQPRVTFSSASTLHVVLLQTDSRDEQQQLVRTVQPLWWGGIALGDMEVKTAGGSTLLALPTAYKTSSIDPVEVGDSIDILSTGTLTITITGDTGQTAHCCDCTASLERIIGVMQTQYNLPDAPPYFGIGFINNARGEGQNFRCNFRVWGNDADGRELFAYNQDTLLPIFTMPKALPSAQNIHWQLEGLGVDEGGPWNISQSLLSLTEAYTVYYAYSATSSSLTVWSPDVPERLMQSLLLDGAVNPEVNAFYDLDEDGNRVPKTFGSITSFSTIAVFCGNGTVKDVSAVQVLNLSNTINTNAVALADIIFTGAGGAEVGRLPALTPAGDYPSYSIVTTPGTVISGAHMASGAVQTLTYQTYYQTVVVSTRAQYNAAAGTWTVTAFMRGNSDSSGGFAVLPADLRLIYGTRRITIEAGQSSVTATGLDYNPSWQTPTATLLSSDADKFTIVVGTTSDITPANWVADYCGTVGGLRCLDVSYAGVLPDGVVVTLSGGEFMTDSPTIDSGRKMANALYRTQRSAGDYGVNVRAGSVGLSYNVTPTEKSDNPVQLTYVVRNISSGYTTDLTNLKADGVSRSRHTNIGDVLPFVRVRKNGRYTYQSAPIYNPVNMALLKPDGRDDVAEYAYSGVIDDADGLVEFVESSSFGSTDIISVGDNLPNIQIFSQNHTVNLPKA